MRRQLQFTLDTADDGEGGWIGRVSVDGHLVFVLASEDTEARAVDRAGRELATRLRRALRQPAGALVAGRP